MIRPTPDRVRETLFNWLAPHLHGARCLDLFAGSGALGLEALSRGASRSVFVDASASAIRSLRATVEQFGVAGAEFVVGDAGHYLRSAAGPLASASGKFSPELTSAVVLPAPGGPMNMYQGSS